MRSCSTTVNSDPRLFDRCATYGGRIAAFPASERRGRDRIDRVGIVGVLSAAPGDGRGRPPWRGDGAAAAAGALLCAVRRGNGIAAAAAAICSPDRDDRTATAAAAICPADGDEPALPTHRRGRSAAIRADDATGRRHSEQRRYNFCQCRAVRSAAATRGDPASAALAAGGLATRPLELERRTICLGGRAICATAHAKRELGPRLLAARTERLDLDRRPLGVGRSHVTAFGGVRPARTASIPSNARKPIASRVSTVALPR